MVLIDYLLHFIEEDAPFGDVTSAAVIPDISCNAVIRAEQPGVIAGIKEVSLLFTHFGVSVQSLVKDGDMVGRGDSLLLLNGDAKENPARRTDCAQYHRKNEWHCNRNEKDYRHCVSN